MLLNFKVSACALQDKNRRKPMTKYPLATLMRARARVAIKAMNDAILHRRDSIEEILEPQAREQFKSVTEVYFAGGGGAGRALPSALAEAQKYGLDFEKLRIVCATSVGTIVGLGVTLGISPMKMKKMLCDMPTDKFQDWSIRRIFNFFTEWGVCSGNEMNAYVRKMIKDETGLDDPTFLELYEAGYTKEFRVLTTNVSKHKTSIFSHRLTPYKKVAELVTTACSIPIVYAPRWLVNERGELEAHTDGGLIKNYPFGLGGDPLVPIEEQLGFNFVNKGAAYALDNTKHTIIDSFWRYFKSLLSMILFQDPLSVSDSIKDRTVTIAVNHNPLKFDATEQEQLALDRAGIKGVRNLISRMLKNNERKKAQLQEPLIFSRVPSPIVQNAPATILRRSPRLQKLG